METDPPIDADAIAKHLKLSADVVRRVTELLEEGNTVPFITRFRRDQSGGLNEPQIRAIEREISREKLLVERKESILRSIESRGQLTEKLAEQIRAARTLSALEDIYLPYKPKKQSLASVARSRGLEPLAREILGGSVSQADIESKVASHVDEAKELPTTDAVYDGLRHLIAEQFGNDPKLRAPLRRHLWRNGKLVSKKVDQPAILDVEEPGEDTAAPSESKAVESTEEAAALSDAVPAVAEGVADPPVAASEPSATDSELTPAESVPTPTDSVPTPTESGPTSAESVPPASDAGTQPPQASAEASTAGELPNTERESVATADDAAASDGATSPAETTPPESSAGENATEATSADAPNKSDKSAAVSRRDQRREMRRRRRERLIQSFKDYFDFSDPIGRIPHHRILAINRGERTKVLRVKLDCADWDSFQEGLQAEFIQQDHPQVEFLRTCLQDAFSRLLVPGIEREVRRELNERAEEHAVSVFARNLRKLLLQPPLHQHRVVAIDPGFRSGCKLVALDEFGSVLGHTFINLLGKEQQKQSGREGLVEFVRKHRATAIAIGNGAACRETEALVADVLTNELKDEDVGYLIVNEAGTSVYSTSDLGREELPEHDATVRSAVSIGRRALDPLSELVKIDPASIGVGLYQHDVKAKHLRASLDAVVESCVNYVGVDVNSASPSLLRYVSGLNSLTARRIFEHRQQHGPFRNREQLKEVSGIGDSTYVQAAGFLKIVDGENPLDGTWIHPESYPVATQVLGAIGFQVADLGAAARRAAPSPDAETPAPTETSAEVAAEPAPDATTHEAAGATESAPAPTAEVTPSEAEGDASTSAPSADSNGQAPTSAEASAEPTGDSAPSDPQSDATTGCSAIVSEQLNSVQVDQLAPQLGVGKLLLSDILKALARPGRDPREDLPAPIFRRGILRLEDLKPGLELSGTVLNVVDFGAFVDIGLVDSGLIHVSRLADRYISDPHDVVSVGDILRVWVVEVDQKRRRVSLTAIEPGTEKPKQAREQRRKPAERKGQGRRPRGERPKRSHSGPKGKRYKPKAEPKPVVPITKEMEDGKEPMRTFGDLKQLFDKRKKGGK